MTRVAVLTSAVGLFDGFVRDLELHRRIGIEIPLVVCTHPSKLLADRLRDLRAGIARRARMTGRSPVAHLVEHFAWRALQHVSMRGATIPTATPAAGQRWMNAIATDDPVVRDALADVRADLAVVFGGSPIPRASLDAMGVPLLNVHASDPAFCRGMPPVFWEVHAGLDAMTLTLHEVVARLDAGAVIAQRTMPIVWQRSLVATLRATRARMMLEVPPLLADGLAKIVSGEARPRVVSPGPLRTLPTLGEIVAAHRRCARRSRAHR